MHRTRTPRNLTSSMTFSRHIHSQYHSSHHSTRPPHSRAKDRTFFVQRGTSYITRANKVNGILHGTTRSTMSRMRLGGTHHLPNRDRTSARGRGTSTNSPFYPTAIHGVTTRSRQSQPRYKISYRHRRSVQCHPSPRFHRESYRGARHMSSANTRRSPRQTSRSRPAVYFFFRCYSPFS